MGKAEIVGLCVRNRGHGFVGNGMAFHATAIEELRKLENVRSEYQRKGHNGPIMLLLAGSSVT